MILLLLSFSSQESLRSHRRLDFEASPALGRVRPEFKTHHVHVEPKPQADLYVWSPGNAPSLEANGGV